MAVGNAGVRTWRPGVFSLPGRVCREEVDPGAFFGGNGPQPRRMKYKPHPLLREVTTLPVIDARSAEALATIGFTTVASLSRYVGDHLGPAELARVKATVALLALEAMPVALADTLAQAGVTSLAQLARAKLARLVDVSSALPSASRPSTHALAELQQEAWRREAAGVVVVRASRADSDSGVHPVPGAVVRVAGRDGQTDERGWVIVDHVPAGVHRAQLVAPGNPIGLGFAVKVPAGGMSGPTTVTLTRELGAPPFFEPQRQIAGAGVSNRGGHKLRVRTVPMAALPDDSYLIVRPPLDDGRVPLVSLAKTRVGFEVLIDRVIVARVDLPVGAEAGQLVRARAGVLEATDRTAEQVTRGWRKAPAHRRHRISVPL